MKNQYFCLSDKLKNDEINCVMHFPKSNLRIPSSWVNFGFLSDTLIAQHVGPIVTQLSAIHNEE